jgi:spore maturation protein CgeB
MKILCVLGKHNYGNPARGEGYGYVNFLPALRRLGHEVVFFESQNRSAYRDFADQNRQFLERVQAESPDIILCVLLGYEIWIETLELVRSCSNAILINWATDDSWKYEQFSRFIAKPFHIYATTYPDAIIKSLRNGHSNFVLTQWAANAEKLAEPLPAAKCRYPVSFVGSVYGNRRRWISELKSRGIEVQCFGFGWENGAVEAQEIPRIMRESIISLNFGDSGLIMKGVVPGRSRQIKARIFEVPGAGGFLVTESAENLEKYYTLNEEIVVYDGVDELVKKINYYTGNPDVRDSIALAGFLRTRNEHTYDARFRQLLEIAERLKMENSHRSKRCDIDFMKYDAIEKRHAVGPWLTTAKWILQLPFLMIWGRRRGVRAARRFLFEISWRVVGKRTYSVSGWPGRLFYKAS